MRKSMVCRSIWLLLIAVVALNAEPVKRIRNFDEFQCVQLSMSVAELKTGRPLVKPFGFFLENESVDTEKPDQMLFEALRDHDIFETVYYKFQGLELDTVVFSGRIQGQHMAKKVSKFLEKCTSIWGKAEDALVVGLDDPKGATPGAPALMWKKGNAVIVAAYTSPENQEELGRGSVQVKLQRCGEEELADSTARKNMLRKIFAMPDVPVEKKSKMLNALKTRVKESATTTHP